MTSLQHFAKLIEQRRSSDELISAGGRFGGCDLLAHRCNESIAALGHGLYVDWLLGAVTQYPADSENVLLDDLGVDVGARPQSLENLVLRDESVAALDHILDQLESLGSHLRARRTSP